MSAARGSAPGRPGEAHFLKREIGLGVMKMKKSSASATTPKRASSAPNSRSLLNQSVVNQCSQ